MATKTTKPQYQTVGDKFIAQTEQGELKIPLRFKTKLLRAIWAKDSLTELEQLFAMLDGIGDKDTAGKLDELDFGETMKIVEAFFKAFEQMHQASPGESSAS